MNKTIGIWGLGVVGQSAVRFFARRQWHIQVMDAKQPTPEQHALLQSCNATFIAQSDDNRTIFLSSNAYVLASPGIDISSYMNFPCTFITEADLFGKSCNVPIVAITGSVGKTTITHLLTTLLQASGKKPFMGGNIGTGMLDMIDMQEQYESAVIEISSFQLEWGKRFAPDLAIITNIYPNHLDRHGTLEQYQRAKLNILAYQITGQQALVPWNLRSLVPQTDAFKNYFSVTPPSENDLASLTDREALFYFTQTHIIHYRNGIHNQLIERAALPTISFDVNWLLLCAALTILRVPLTIITQHQSISVPEHRLELVTTRDGVTFYNDSKSTVPDSTLAAINQLQHQNIILLLGGVSKGVSRESLIQALPERVTEIYCFGKEAEQLQQWCTKYHKIAYSFATLENTIDELQKKLAPGQCVLFSPAGTSYDLFTDYQQRGAAFKNMIMSYR